MKKQILLVIGFAGALAAQPVTEARADVRIGINIPGGPGIYFDSRPDFIYMDDYGFSVSYGGAHDVIYYGNAYFIFRDGYWYRAYDYRGPWGRISNFELPGPIRRHGWDDIRRRRDIEYRRHDRGFWEDRFRSDREHWRGVDNRRGPDDRRWQDDRRGPVGPPPQPDHRGPIGPPPQPDHRGPIGPPPPAEQRGPAGPQGPNRPPAPSGIGRFFGQPAPAEQRGPAGPQKPAEKRAPDNRDDRDRRDDRDGRTMPGGGPGDRQDRR